MRGSSKHEYKKRITKTNIDLNVTPKSKGTLKKNWTLPCLVIHICSYFLMCKCLSVRPVEKMHFSFSFRFLVQGVAQWKQIVAAPLSLLLLQL
jgi:hypothetical protein